MTTNEYYQISQGLLNYAQSGSLSPDEWNGCFLFAQTQVYNDALEVFERTQNISEILSPFKTVTAGAQTGNGKWTKPNDYMRLSAFSQVVNATTGVTRKVKILKDDEWAEASTSLVVPPSLRPICNEQDTYFRFLPADLIFQVNYLRKLVPGKWGYTMSGLVVVYDAGTTIECPFTSIAAPEIIYRLCIAAGLNLDKQYITSYMATKANQPPIFNT